MSGRIDHAIHVVLSVLAELLSHATTLGPCVARQFFVISMHAVDGYYCHQVLVVTTGPPTDPCVDEALSSAGGGGTCLRLFDSQESSERVMGCPSFMSEEKGELT